MCLPALTQIKSGSMPQPFSHMQSAVLVPQQSLMCLAAQVAVQNSLLFENTYQPIPGYVPKEPTASQVPTEIRGAVSLTIFNAGQTAITVSPPFHHPALNRQPQVCMHC